MLKIGDKVSARITYEGENGHAPKQKTGTVIYIHPKGRFFRARFKADYGAYRTETFQLVNGLPLRGEAELLAYGQ